MSTVGLLNRMLISRQGEHAVNAFNKVRSVLPSYDNAVGFMEKQAERLDRKMGFVKDKPAETAGDISLHKSLSRHGNVSPRKSGMVASDIHNNISSRNAAANFFSNPAANIESTATDFMDVAFGGAMGTKATPSYSNPDLFNDFIDIAFKGAMGDTPLAAKASGVISNVKNSKVGQAVSSKVSQAGEYLKSSNMSPQNFIQGYEKNIQQIADERSIQGFDLQRFLNKGDSYEGLDAGMAAMRKEVLQGIDSEKFFTKRGMEGMLDNFDTTGNLYSGFNKAGETQGSPLVNLLSGTTDNAAKNAAGLLGTAALAGGVNTMMGGDFGEGAMVGGLAAFSARGISQAYMKNMGGMEKSFMKRTIGKAGSEAPGTYKYNKGLDSTDVQKGIPRRMNLSQIKHIANNEGLSSGVQKEAKAFIERKGPNRVMAHNRSMTIGGGMLAGVAFTGRSDKRDYRRGFNSHRGNRV